MPIFKRTKLKKEEDLLCKDPAELKAMLRKARLNTYLRILLSAVTGTITLRLVGKATEREQKIREALELRRG